jgi:pilus assembly protein CpaC
LCAPALNPSLQHRELIKMKTLKHNIAQFGSAAKAIRWSIALLSSLLLFAPLLPKSAVATDMAPTTEMSNPAHGHSYRIALNKSAVVTLPAEAKDVVVGNTEIVDVVIRNKNTAYLFARKSGSTNIFFFDANGQQIMAMDLEVALDTTALQELLHRNLPGTHIVVDVIGNNVALGGIAMNPAEAKEAEDLANEYIGAASFFLPGGKVVNTMKIAGEDQVMLQVKMVEVQRDVLKQWGVNFGAAIKAGAFAFNLANINPFSSNLIETTQGYGASFADSNGNAFSAILRAMESDGMLHTLAEPNLTAVSGQSASFKAGGEFPYQTCQQSNGVLTCQVAFKEYGVGLDFTPTVLTAGRINLKVHTSVSELNNVQTGTLGIVGAVPSLNKREAETVLEMPDGGSMMLAGLIRESTRQTINGTPGLKKLPILGALFRSRDFIQNQTELVVLVTPHIVRSVAQKQLETPDKNLNEATDRQTILMGRLNKVYGTGSGRPHGSYSGNVGYVVE